MALVTMACYRYTPVELSAAQEGTPVRVEVTARAVDRLRDTPQSRLVSGFSVTGSILRYRSDSVYMSVPTSVLDASARTQTVNRELMLGRDEVRNARIRRLDRKRTTWLSIGLGATAVASVAFSLQRGGRSGGLPPNPQGPPEHLIPFSRIAR